MTTTTTRLRAPEPAAEVARTKPATTGPGCACAGGVGGCRCHGNARRIQRKLAVGPVGDRFEQEADRVADEIVGPGRTTSVAPAEGAPRISRLAGRSATAVDHVDLPPSSGAPLPAGVRNVMEPRFGTDFGGVRVHTGDDAAATSASLGARAFTTGSDIWLGSGESTDDHRLMAHELTHVVQQSGGGASGSPIAQSTPIVQRQPACGTSTKTTTIDVFAVSLPGSSRDPGVDVAQANTVWAQCAVQLNLVSGESWDTKLMDSLAPTGVLNEYKTMTAPTAEEVEMLGHQPGGAGVIHLYYVPGLSDGNVGENFRPSVNPSVPKAVVVSDSGHVDTLAHELGHVLLDVSGHEADRDNLMARGRVRNKGVDKLECRQCGRL